MSQSVAATLLVLVAFCAANLPFLTQRRWLVGPGLANKSLGVRMLELMFLYFCVGSLGLLLENSAGQISPQKWEFYAITGTLFLTFAFPGFCYRYLLKRLT
ncbi:DUF2818 family protein [Rhodoferax sp. PAMC 29310]|uniref:DUF2818 family protein n=1 Tax=Rhodoferax sp. PAMC 29310 TaxID=2822760 RepID=UPI001B32F84B|nr:DUF2818 family protein [Rhodoferax sp. PAMC 29310]